MVLVPKKRGTGYLRVPYGHHHNQVLTAIANSVGCDLTGLDGALVFEGTTQLYYGAKAGRLAFELNVMPKLEVYYKTNSRRADPAEFWQEHPLFN